MLDFTVTVRQFFARVGTAMQHLMPRVVTHPDRRVGFDGTPRIGVIAPELSTRRVRRMGPAWAHLTAVPRGRIRSC